MKTTTPECLNARTAIAVALLLLTLNACGGGSSPAADGSSQGPGAASSSAAGAGNSNAGPDTSGLAAIILGKINEDPMRQEMKVIGKLADFNVTSAETEQFEEWGASTVVECAGTVVFDGDVQWHWQDMEPRKAGEPAKFECSVEYANQGNGWQIIGPMAIHPL